MAGLGRRTHYRKHLTDQVLFDFPVPEDETEQIGKIVSTRGSNQFDVRLSKGGSTVLAILPTKYRKLVWLKRNDFVIVESGVENDQGPPTTTGNIVEAISSGGKLDSKNDNTASDATAIGGIRFMIKHILYKDQIRNLIEKQLWPHEDPEFQTELSLGLLSQGFDGIDDSTLPTQGSDGIVYECDHNDGSEDNDDDLFVNTNRVAALNLDESSSSSEEDE